MATITSVRIPESLQTLIDSRLDTIDRMLLGRLPRSERLEITREVESRESSNCSRSEPATSQRERTSWPSWRGSTRRRRTCRKNWNGSRRHVHDRWLAS